MTKIDIAKKITSTIVGVGASKIAHAIIQNNTPQVTTTDKVTVTSASVVIGYAASDVTSSYTDRKIDEAILWWKTNVTPSPKKN